MALRLIGKAPPDASLVPIAASSQYITPESFVTPLVITNCVSEPSTIYKKDTRIPLAEKQLENRALHPQPSKLDLIDHTTLTSLPLPPPPAKSRLKRGKLTPLLPRKPLSEDSKIHIAPDRTQDGAESGGENDFADITMTSEYVDDTFEESEDLIVLVEDYLAKHESEKQLDRSKSLITFKKRLHADRRSLESNEPEPKRRALELAESTNCEDLEAIFGRIPGMDRLKHCCLCDRPLYEISSIIGNGDSRRGKVDVSVHCKEFVCWDCVDTYELFLMQEQQAEDKELQAVMKANERLFDMFSHIRDTYRALPPLSLENSVSSELIQQLHILNQSSEEAKDPEWLSILKSKLRWRWRLNDLLPTFASQSGNEAH